MGIMCTDSLNAYTANPELLHIFHQANDETTSSTTAAMLYRLLPTGAKGSGIQNKLHKHTWSLDFPLRTVFPPARQSFRGKTLKESSLCKKNSLQPLKSIHQVHIQNSCTEKLTVFRRVNRFKMRCWSTNNALTFVVISEFCYLDNTS